MDYLDLIDSSHVLVFICIIGFIIKLYLILLISKYLI
jgi:preprotein translocase subunit Sss1